MVFLTPGEAVIRAPPALDLSTLSQDDLQRSSSLSRSPLSRSPLSRSPLYLTHFLCFLLPSPILQNLLFHLESYPALTRTWTLRKHHGLLLLRSWVPG